MMKWRCFFMHGIAIGALLVNDGYAEEKPIDVTRFLEAYCVDCHSADDPAGQRDLESLDWSASDFDTQLSLQDAIDQLTLRSMPPEDSDQPTTKERLTAIDGLTERLSKMREVTTSTSGQTVLRRLSRREYKRTVADLLQIDMTMFDPTLEFPGDNLSEHFDNVGDALVMSGHLLERYLAAADQCVEKARNTATDRMWSESSEPKQWVFRDSFVQQAELRTAHRRAFRDRYLCLYDHPFNDKTEGGYGHIQDFTDGVPVDGIYEIRVHAKAMHRDTPYTDRAVRIDLEEPFRLGVRPGDTRIGDMPHRQPIQPLLAQANVSDQSFEWITFQVPLDRGFVPRFTFENGIHDVRGSFGRLYRLHREDLPRSIRNKKGIFEQRIAIISEGQLPHIRIDEVQIRGPIEFSLPTQSQLALFHGPPPTDAEWSTQQAKQRIDSFASRAFRRPPTKTELASLTSFYESRRTIGENCEQAYVNTVKAILCSPAFLYFQNPADSSATLTDHGLAERLSYFLTSSMPDARLRQLADQGVLHEEATLRAEVKRLLASSESDAFVADFLDNWLNLRSLGSMPPDPRGFWFFYAGDLSVDMKTETERLFRDFIDRDIPLVDLLTTSHSFLNRDMAKLYGVEHAFPAEDAISWRRFDFSNDPAVAREGRGGLLGQASILTVSANGIETSPVTRGVWLLDNILGTPTPPPPDDVPAIEPDTRGAKTIRDQLTRHSDDATCNQCHRKIDPLGFALEGFDAIGQFRRTYNTKPRRPIDTSGELPGGAKFDGTAELKQQLAAQQEFLVRTVTERLLMQALGRRMEPIDRAAIDAIWRPLKSEGYPTAQLIEAIVLSDLFRR